MKRLLKTLDLAMEAMTFLAGALLIFIMLSVCSEVVLRTFFDISQMWVTEIAECTLLYITFLASAWVLREEAHVRVDIVVGQLEERTARGLNILSSLIGVFVSVVLTVFGAMVTWDYFQRGIYTPSALEIPVHLIQVVIPVGSLLLSAQFVRRAVRDIGWFLIESKPEEERS